jgi:hypothetical protein
VDSAIDRHPLGIMGPAGRVGPEDRDIVRRPSRVPCRRFLLRPEAEVILVAAADRAAEATDPDGRPPALTATPAPTTIGPDRRGP